MLHVGGAPRGTGVGLRPVASGPAGPPVWHRRVNRPRLPRSIHPSTRKRRARPPDNATALRPEQRAQVLPLAALATSRRTAGVWLTTGPADEMGAMRDPDVRDVRLGG